MFIKGFEKTASSAALITPEEYYNLKAEKDPYIGALAGAAVGAGVGGYKHRTAKAALKGTGAGAAGGLLTGYLAGKAGKAIRLGILKHEIENLNLKTTPGRQQHFRNEGGR